VARGASSSDVVSVNRHEVTSLCLAVLSSAGAGRRVAELLTEAALFAEDRSKAVVGVAHLLDHVDAMDDGRLDGRAVPRIAHPSPAVITSDARGGIAQTGFDESLAPLVQAARHYGLAAFAQQGSFTCGPLGWFTERLADAGLVAVATAVAPAMLAAGPGTGRVFGTNPMAYSVPRTDRAPFTVDQASSSTAHGTRDRAPRPSGCSSSPSTTALSGAVFPRASTTTSTDWPPRGYSWQAAAGPGRPQSRRTTLRSGPTSSSLSAAGLAAQPPAVKPWRYRRPARVSGPAHGQRDQTLTAPPTAPA
jgi:hypothetical protein